jgi:hypothetical protein
MVIRSWRVPLRFLLSVTRTVKSKSPAVVGVPEILPMEFKPRPGGKVPAGAVKAYGAAPPLAAMAPE